MAKIIQFKDENDDNMYPVGYNQGGAKIDLLWTNPDTNIESGACNSFSAQTVTLDLSDYDFFILFVRNYNTTGTSTNINKVGSWLVKNINNQMAIALDGGRAITSISDTGITFGSGTSSDASAIPYKLYGIKLSYVVPTVVNGLQYVEVE